MDSWPRWWGLTPGECMWVGTGLALLAYELWALATGRGDLLTAAMRANLDRWAVWPVGIGVVIGHLFSARWDRPEWLVWAWPLAVLAALVRDLALQGRVPIPPAGLLFLVGYALGAITWSPR